MIRVARNRDAGVTIEQIAKDFGIQPMSCLKWLRQADRRATASKPGASDDASRPSCVSCERGSGCSSRRTRSCAGRRRICRRRTCRENDVPARPRAGRRRDPRRGDVPGPQARPPALLPVAGRPGHRRRARPRRTGRTRCSTPTATTPSSGTGSWPTRPATPASRWPSGPRGGSARTTAGGRAFGKKRGKNGKKPGPPVHDDLVRPRLHRRRARTSCGWPTSPSTATGEGKLYLCAIKDVLLQPDRRLLDRLTDEVPAGRRRARATPSPRRGRRRRLRAAHRPRVAVSKPGSSCTP